MIIIVLSSYCIVIIKTTTEVKLETNDKDKNILFFLDKTLEAVYS